ncbi:hypothetical protein SY94_5257 (plasmid) [Agrobacterium tumefaciens]|nr:hypothetical protein SY94_5257 [Agrobacterium tumefaciens]
MIAYMISPDRVCGGRLGTPPPIRALEKVQRQTATFLRNNLWMVKLPFFRRRTIHD